MTTMFPKVKHDELDHNSLKVRLNLMEVFCNLAKIAGRKG